MFQPRALTPIEAHARDGLRTQPALTIDVAVDTADVVLMRSDPVDVSTAITIGRGARRKARQNLAWAVGYNSIAIPSFI